MIGWLVALGVILVLQIAVMVVGLKCDIAHDKCTKPGSSSREKSEVWDGILMGTLVLFLLGVVIEIVAFFAFLIQDVPQYDQDYKLRCESIDGEFSKKLNSCYKDGAKIVFDGGEQVYNAE